MSGLLIKWYIYKGINHTQREIYFGVSKEPKERIDGSHCDGGTKALEQWNCNKELITWEVVSNHPTQKSASQIAHGHELTFKAPQGYKIIRTAGI